MGIKEEITKIAVEQGYEGAKPKSIAQAIDALTDTLAGEDVKSGRSVVDAIRKYAPYVGSGGGTKRVELFNETVTTTEQDDYIGIFAELAYTGDLAYDPLHVIFEGAEYELPRSESVDAAGKVVQYGTFINGEPSFSTYPLALAKYSDTVWMAYTETAGTHTIVAYTEKSSGDGGAALGELQAMPRIILSPPSVGGVLDSPSSLEVVEMRVGSQAVFGNPFDDPAFTYGAAAGVTVVACVSEASDIEDISTYLATGTENDGDITVETLEDFDLDVSVDINHDTISFVMPEWDAEEGQFPIMYTRRSFN